MVIHQVQTAHLGIVANPKQLGGSFRKKTAQNLDRIKNNPLATIITLLNIYQEVLPSMIDVGPITPWELLKTLYTGTSVTEFNEILFKASSKTFKFIQTYSSEKICIATDENSNEF